MVEPDTEPQAADPEPPAPALHTGGPSREAGRQVNPPHSGLHLTRTHRILVGVVMSGVVVIAGIGFAGSYAAVRTLALHKGFGAFANVFPIGVDAGIVVLLALDLLLTWLRIPFPLLRQTAWLLTIATIAFNGAAAWPDKLGVGMHAIIPVLFVVSVEAARHAIGRIADITADKHMEGVRITRWLLAPLPTFRLWRRMKLWELRSYEEVIRREQDRLVYRARLRARYGVAWRRKAPIEAIMPLRLARYGVPLTETAEAGLEAAGIQGPALPHRPAPATLEPEPLERGPLEQRPTEPIGLEHAGAAAPDAGAALEHPAREHDPDTHPDAAARSARPTTDSTGRDDGEARFQDYRDYAGQYSAFPNSHQLQQFQALQPQPTPAGEGPPEETERAHPARGAHPAPDTAAVAPGTARDPGRRAQDPGEWTTESVTESVTDASDRGMTDPAGHRAPATTPPVTESVTESVITSSVTAPAMHHTPDPDPAGAPARVTAERPGADAQPPRPAAPDLTPGIPAARTGDAAAGTRREAPATDPAEATARAPEQWIDQTPVSELTEDQRIERIVQWLAEAEATGKRLSGAEAARRNEVSPSTGQRDMRQAKDLLAQRQREQGRAHLRSVGRSRP